MAIGLRESAPQVRCIGRATSKGQLMLCESCASGEDWRDIHIDTEVLNEIAPLAQNRGARKSHHLPIVAGIVDKRLHNLDITFIPRLHKIVAQSLNRSPEIGNSAYYGITANDCLGIAETKAHILCVERCKLLHIHGIDYCIIVFCPVRHRIILLWYVSTISITLKWLANHVAAIGKEHAACHIGSKATSTTA